MELTLGGMELIWDLELFWGGVELTFGGVELTSGDRGVIWGVSVVSYILSGQTVRPNEIYEKGYNFLNCQDPFKFGQKIWPNSG